MEIVNIEFKIGDLACELKTSLPGYGTSSSIHAVVKSSTMNARGKIAEHTHEIFSVYAAKNRKRKTVLQIRNIIHDLEGVILKLEGA